MSITNVYLISSADQWKLNAGSLAGRNFNIRTQKVASVSEAMKREKAKFSEIKPNAFLLDASKDIDQTLSEIKAIQNAFPLRPVFVGTTDIDPRDAFSLMQAGVRGVIDRKARMSEVAVRIKQALGEQIVGSNFYLSQKLLELDTFEIGGMRVDPSTQSATHLQKPLTVSTDVTMLSLLELAHDKPGQHFSQKGLLGEIFIQAKGMRQKDANNIVERTRAAIERLKLNPDDVVVQNGNYFTLNPNTEPTCSGRHYA